MFKIALDTLGFENDPFVAYEAAKEFLLNYNDVKITLITNNALKNRLINQELQNIDLVITEEYATQNDQINIIRQKKNLSIQVGCDLLNENKVDALISSCNTAIFVAATYIKIGTLDGVKKFAFLTTLPTIEANKDVYLLDSGANKSCTGLELYQFALMANIYVKKVSNIKNPRVGLINVGTEKTKGFEEHKEADQYLEKDKNINYVGYSETRNVLNNQDADIFVCNGYTGNIVLKTLEGALKTVGKFFSEQYHKWYNALAYLFNKKIINTLKHHFDYKDRAGAFLLGLKKPVMKGHGSSDKQQLLSCLKMMYNALKQEVFSSINKEIGKFTKEND